MQCGSILLVKEWGIRQLFKLNKCTFSFTKYLSFPKKHIIFHWLPSNIWFPSSSSWFYKCCVIRVVQLWNFRYRWVRMSSGCENSICKELPSQDNSNTSSRAMSSTNLLLIKCTSSVFPHEITNALSSTFRVM